jgi:cell shape-determining protein MreC
MARHQPTSAEYQSLLTENDALRAELAECKDQLTRLQQVRRDEVGYLRDLRNENFRLHSELRFFNRREERK